MHALRIAGCGVVCTQGLGMGFADLVVGRAGQTYLLEVKTKTGKLTKEESEFALTWPGHYAVVRTDEDALLAVGL